MQIDVANSCYHFHTIIRLALVQGVVDRTSFLTELSNSRTRMLVLSVMITARKMPNSESVKYTCTQIDGRQALKALAARLPMGTESSQIGCRSRRHLDWKAHLYDCVSLDTSSFVANRPAYQ